VGYGVLSTKAYYGQSPGYGYFAPAGYDLSGWEVMNVSCSASGEYGPYNYNNGNTWCNAIPRDLNSAGELIAFVEGRLANGVPNGSYGFGSGTYGDTRARTGAAALVHTMIGTPTGSRSRPPTATQMNDWRNLVNQYSAAGRINWSTQAYSFGVNSLFQGTDNAPSPNDVTFYSEYNDGAAIVFTAPNGTVYAIRRECGNPVGGTSLPDLQDFDMSGTSSVNDNTVFVGQSITFSHSLTNGGPTGTSPTSIAWTTQSASLPAGPWGNVSSGNAGTFNVETKPNIGNETITVPSVPPDTQICRRIHWTPDTETGGSGDSAPACATVQYDYNLNPVINAVVTSGGSPITGNIAEQGDSVTFTYQVNNGGTTISRSTSCTIYGLTRTGYYPVPSPNDSSSDAGYVQPAHGCPRVFPANSSTTLVSETVPASTTNRSICRVLNITPATVAGAPRSTEVCVYVASKPYVRVWGGDLSAGNGLADASGACTANTEGAVVGWNRRSAGSWSGAGTQYAIYAMDVITDFADALYDPGGAPAPNGLSFANTNSDTNNGDFGGEFGDASCIADHYSSMPAGTPVLTSPINLSSLTSGNYQASGNVTISNGTIVNPNNRITLYVNGNVYINSGAAGIQYSGSWSVANMPLFRLIVRGNIYIDNDVSRLDGVYIAQRNGANTGEIHTCMFGGGFTPPAITGTFFSECDNKLTVNGAFIAHQIRLLRTLGTLSQSNTSEASTVPYITEVFNYSPALWINQPTTSSTPTSDYDAIISLPPVL
jgi:hypothetical protein